MAFQASTSALRRIRPRITQWESVTGRRIPPSLLRQWLEAELSVEAGRAERSRALDIQQQGVDLQEERLGLLGEQLEAERGAAKVSGVAELATGGLLLGKEFGLFKGAQSLLAGGTTAAGAAGAGKAVTAGVGTFPWAGGILPGGTTAAGAGVGGTTAAAGGTAAPTAGAGLLSLAAPAAIGAGAGFLGKLLTGAGRPGHMGGERITSAGIGALGGAGAGFLVGGPIGAIIGGIVGLISGGK